MAETRAELAKLCFRKLPPASADAQRMCGRETEDGKRKIIRKTDQKWSKWKKQGRVGQILLPSASVSIRGQWVAVISLISDFYLLDSVGNFAVGRREEENYEENGA